MLRILKDKHTLLILALTGAAAVASVAFAEIPDPLHGVRLAFPPLLALIPSIIGGVAAAAGGIAAGVGSANAAKTQSEQADADRKAREEQLKMQLEEQKRQANEQQKQGAQQNLQSAYGSAAQTALAGAQGRMGANTDIQSSLAKAYLG